ncbi:UNVERIFIED_CONTAM: Transposon TX1 uncharacterized protein [Sesamum calycinum]|uniref:Transposon TX1 uncharacterized protein n=1 Tax=Sesamum calycinum TaxID=2727403 RepID=A0AAW2LS61_9LAMI
MLNAAVWNVRGLNRRDHQIAVRELAMNSRLHFLGLLETRVTLPNAARVQNGILPSSHIYVLVTVSYGANDVGSRRELWQALSNISGSINDEPWLVGGDFNAVRDLSEVCGTSGDIRLAMNEFNEYILNTGLIALPMRGERFTWHNCSDDGRSLWKRLDCFLANDKWMEQWPDVFYDCLTPRTSDHSPLVLRGDCRRLRLVFLKAVKIEQGYGFTILAAWARHIITDEEASLLIRPITKDDVKTAVFDIEEDRAPGPDGYSSGFFKAAWPVVGEEITAAVMDFFTTDKLISPSQTAFVPGRSISDNVLLAQELFSGYNHCRLPPRCALKVDLRKAYDTVEWDFLLATLQLFGFPPTFTRWIEECVTSPHFSLYLNGEDGGFAYHWQCKELGLFQLSFADDLFLLCKAEEGRLPLRYLGLPLIASRLTMLDCQPLLQKIDARIRGWDGVGLSFAGRVQLINGYPKVAWESVCKPIEEGGQGIRDILALNRALMSRHLWSVIKHEKESIWVEWIAHYRLVMPLWTVNAKRGAWSWRKMLELRGTLLPHIQLKIGTGESFSLWHDPWHNLGPLILRFPRGPQLTGTAPMATLSVVIEDNMWSWPLITDIAHLEIIQNLPPIHTGCDVITWDSNGGDSQMQQPITYSGRRT